MSKRKNEIGLDLGGVSGAQIDANTVEDLRELISKLAGSKHYVEALERNDLAGMLAFLETFESPAAEQKFILHHMTTAVTEQKPQSLLRWTLVYMLRHSKTAPEHLLHDVLKVLPTRPH